jgi:DNA polymerase III epsilon subunit-like protein
MLHYNLKLPYTPALEPYELNERALVIDTETIGRGQTLEVIEIAIADHRGRIIFESLVKPSVNRLPPLSKHHRFDRSEFETAPDWAELWPELSKVIRNKLLVAYNAAYDRRALAVTCALHRLSSNERAWRCAMQLVKTRMGLRHSPTLGEACALFGLEGGNHRARRDTEALCEMLRKVCEMIAVGKGSG